MIRFAQGQVRAEVWVGRAMPYADQIAFSSAFLALNTLPPLLLPKSEAANILYLTSWASLGLAVVAAFFGTPFLSTYTDRNRWMASAMLAAFLLCIASAIGAYSVISLMFPHILGYGWFLGFTAVWAGVDLTRKVHQARRNASAAFSISLAAALAILVSLSMSRSAPLWMIAAVATSGVLVMALVNLRSWQDWSQVDFRGYWKTLAGLGGHSMLSFIAGWIATQGVFVVFFRRVDSSAFIDQKSLYSILGMFGVLASVQYNKYQPLFVESVENRKYADILKYRKEISIENLLISAGAMLVVGLVVWMMRNPAWLVFAFLAAFRFFYFAAMVHVYLLRALRRHADISRINVVSCAVAYATIMISAPRLNAALALGFATYGLAFYLQAWLLGGAKEKAMVAAWESGA